MKRLIFKTILGFVLLAPVAVVGFYLLLKYTPDMVVTPRPRPRKLTRRQKLEKQLKQAGKLLLAVDYQIPDEAAGRSLRFNAALLQKFELYLKDPNSPTDFVFLGRDGQVQESRANGTAGKDRGAAAAFAQASEARPAPALVVRERGELLFSHNELWLFADGRCYPKNLAAWDLYWVVAETQGAEKPELATIVYPRRQMADGFMRKELREDSEWIISKGAWTLKKHGGGMPLTEAQEKSYSFQRAVNPFSVIGSGNGILSYGTEDWLNAHVEARFYFGIPWKEGAVDTRTMPLGTDMLVAQGSLDGPQAAFGWHGRSGAFVLFCKPGGGEWRELARWDKLRPPLSNWVRIGLQLRHGWLAEGYLDGEKVVAAELERRVTGPFQIMSGRDEIELDDVRAWALPKEPGTGQPVYVRSRNFAGKMLKGRSDPEQFSEWARGADTFLKHVERGDDYKKATILIRMPLMGDFIYTAVPTHEQAGELPFGIYEVAFYTNPTVEPARFDKLNEVFRMQLIRDENGWVTATDKGVPWAISEPQLLLRVRRRAADGNRLALEVADKFVPLTNAVDKPLHVAIARLLPPTGTNEFPDPRHHSIHAQNLHNEFFEQAPTAWSWIEGGFRMDSRWACQNQWNFMACGGIGVPMLVSKAKYSGNQEHEYYLSLRPVFPSDAGDPNFVYKTQEHRHLFGANGGWYTRRDLNFSFCTDGRNPMSGYAVIFGGDDNRETRLLRRGKIVARTKDYRLPDNPGVGAVHWRWWNFHVRKYDGRIMVLFNNRKIFDYRDPEPLEGGHIAFWTVRNGFTVARVTSVAERLGRDAQVLYVSDDDPGIAWQPLLADSVTLSKLEGFANTLVTANVGAGFFAVRYRLPKPVDLYKQPLLELPLDVPDNVKVNIHLEVDHKAYLVKATAPLGGSKALLCPEFERRPEQFRIPTISTHEMTVQRLVATVSGGSLIRFNLREFLWERGHRGRFLLTSITIGNSSNENYLLTGNGANNAGASYAVGTPKLLAAPR